MKKIMLLIFCLTFARIEGLLAEEVLQEQAELQRLTLEAGPEVSYIKYEEPGIMDETGVMAGMSALFAYHNRFMLKAEGKSSWGQVDYDGSLQDGTSYTISGINDVMLEFRGLGGYDFRVSRTTFITPYIGFGYRYLNDDSSKDPAGYERESNYYYSPIGVETFSEFGNGWSFGSAVEYDLFWYGLQKSHLEDVAAGLNTVNNDQKQGWGVRGSVKIRKEWKDMGLVIEPFIKYWNIKKSDEAVVTYNGVYIGRGWEPKNNSLEIGGKIAVVF